MPRPPIAQPINIAIKSIHMYFRRSHPAPFNREILTSSTFVETELLQSLKMYSDVKYAGQELLKKFGHPHPAGNFPKLQAFLRQAVSFYESAERMHYRVSPLLYCYSIMNASKAAIFVHDTNANLNRVHHGLNPSQYSSSLRGNKIKIPQRGVFPLLYSLVIGAPHFPNAEIRILDLFGYVNDIRYEYQLFGLGDIKNAGCRYANVSFHGEAGGRGLFVLEPVTPKFIKRASQVLAADFTQIKIPNEEAQSIFGLDAQYANASTFWETKALFPFDANGTFPASHNHASRRKFGSSLFQVGELASMSPAMR